MTKKIVFVVAALGLFASACGDLPAAEETAGQKAAALSTASTTEVVTSILEAARQLQAATAHMNAVVAGAYSLWPSKAEFERAQTIRGYRNDLAALNAAADIAGAYAAGAYFNPSLNAMDRIQLGGAYASNISSGGAYVIGAHFSGAYVLPTGGVGGAYVAGAYSQSILEHVSIVNRE